MELPTNMSGKGPRFYVINKGSDSDEDDTARGKQRVNGPRHPLPQPPRGAPFAPAPLATSSLPRYNQSHPPLSSPSSTSSPAAEESTPPPSTPALPIPPGDLPDTPAVHDDSYPFRNGPKPVQALKSPFQKHQYTRPLGTALPRRPTTSPTASTPDSFTSNSSLTPGLALPEKTLILVTVDSDHYVNVDITGAQSAAHIRESVFNRLNIFDEKDRSLFSVYRTEIGSFALGDALSDEQLFHLCRDVGDAKGSLKLLVSHTHASVHEPLVNITISNTPATSVGTIPPPVLPEHAPLQPKRRRHGSLSSASDSLPVDVGYDADLDNPDYVARPAYLAAPASHLSTSSPPEAVHPSKTPAAIRPTSPLPSRPNTPPPSTPNPDHLTGLETPTAINRYGKSFVVPGPPPPISSPNRPSFPHAESSIPGPSGSHGRSPSDTADRDSPTLIEQKRREQRLGPHRRPENGRESPKRTRRPRHDIDDPIQRSDSWVVVGRGGEGTLESPLIPSDGPRTPRSGPKQQVSPSSRYKATGYNARNLTIPNPPRNAPPAVPTTAPDRTPPISRPPGQPVPANWTVTWKGEEKGDATRLPPSASSNWGRLATKGTRSMDNLRANNHPPPLRPGGGGRQLPMTRTNGHMTFTRDPASAGLPKSYENRSHMRPLPMQGSSTLIHHPNDVQTQYTSRPTGYSNGLLSPDPYPRPVSALGEAVSSPPGAGRYPRQTTFTSSGDPLDGHRSPNHTLFSSTSRSNLNYERQDVMLGPSSPPTSPLSPLHTRSWRTQGRSNGVDSNLEATLTKDEPSAWLQRLAGTSVDGTVIPTRLEMLPSSSSTEPPPFSPASRYSYDSDDSDRESAGTGIWQRAPDRPTSILRRPSLTVRIEDTQGVVQAVSFQEQPTQPAPQLRPVASGSASKSNSDKRASTFSELETTWAPRPPPEDVLERLEDFFPEHDLDKPLIEANNSGGTSPTLVETFTPPSAPVQPNNEKSRVRSKKSIRHVAEEHMKRFDRTSKAESYSSTMMRKRSTKLWGSKVEEVTTVQSKTIVPSLSESSPGGPSTFKWVRGELIGRGTYGRVYLAMNATTGEMIAVKQVETPQNDPYKDESRQVTVVQALKSESETLKDLDHPNIVQYLGFEETPTNLSIFLEYVPGGSIGGCLAKHGKFDEEVTKHFTAQILSGLEYLHSKGILHRDLKADNILVELSGVCKISDFGISKRTDDDGAATAMQGTVYWMAPEVVNPQGKTYNLKVDIWSVGCVVLEMWAGSRPWQGDEVFAVMFKLYQQKLPPPIPEGVVLSELADDFRRKCFAVNPDDRPSAAELRKHKYLELEPGWQFTGFK